MDAIHGFATLTRGYLRAPRWGAAQAGPRSGGAARMRRGGTSGNCEVSLCFPRLLLFKF